MPVNLSSYLSGIKRIALIIIRLVGLSASRLMLGFMLASAFLSMWISNTATTMMMVPIALAVIIKLEESASESTLAGVKYFCVGLLLAIAHASSIGGIATLVGTPPNLSLARIFAINFEQAPEISFTQWIVFALPLSLVMLVFTWLYLTKIYAPKMAGTRVEGSVFRHELQTLGPMSREAILKQVWSYTPYWVQKGYDEYAAPVRAWRECGFIADG